MDEVSTRGSNVERRAVDRVVLGISLATERLFSLHVSPLPGVVGSLEVLTPAANPVGMPRMGGQVQPLGILGGVANGIVHAREVRALRNARGIAQKIARGALESIGQMRDPVIGA